MITYGSLCTGYDGLGTALRLAGLPIEHRWMSEIDEAVSHVLKLEHPSVPNVGDVKTAPWGLAPHVDIMSSGDPCQSISIAGRQLGRADPRFLWPWVRAAYRTVRPGAIFFENVANLASHDGGRTLAERHDGLRQDGYEVRWTVLGACAVGAPHHRHRYYAVAGLWADAGPVPTAVRVGGDKQICGAPKSGGRVLLPSPDASMATRGGLLSAERALLRSRRTATGGTLEDAIATLLPSPRQSDGQRGGEDLRSRRTATGGTLEDAVKSVALLPTPKATDGTNRGPGQRDGAGNFYLPGIANMLPTPTDSETWGRFADAITLWEGITGVPAPAPTRPGPRGGPRLSAALPEWMMGLRPGLLTDRLDRADALKAAGNGVVPLAAAAAWRLLTGRS